jgi:hypothetical protein
LAAAHSDGPGNRGITLGGIVGVDKSNISYVFVDAIETQHPSFPIKANRKITAHETGHQFLVNLNDPDKHCGYMTHSNAALKCIMHRNDADQIDNDVAAFDDEDPSPESNTGIGDIHDVRTEQDPLQY